MLMWWRTWHDAERRLWADRQMAGDPAEGKKQHAADKKFGWADGLFAPAVSPLEFTDENGHSQYIAAGWARELPEDRAYYVGGADQVSTQVKAEVQPAEPGSSPGGSTELPF